MRRFGSTVGMLLLAATTLPAETLPMEETAPPPAEVQIAAATAAAPEDRRDGARVLGYDATGELVELRAGTNDLVCLADEPGDERFHVACYHVSLEPYMRRGRELRSEGMTGPENIEQRHREAEAGELEMPGAPASVYNLGGPLEIFDPSTGAVSGGTYLWAIYIPWADEATTGLPTTPQKAGAPWIMRPGTASAHIMVVEPRPVVAEEDASGEEPAPSGEEASDGAAG